MKKDPRYLKALQTKRQVQELRKEVQELLTEICGEDFVKILPDIYNLLGYYVSSRFNNQYTLQQLEKLVEALSRILVERSRKE